MISYPNLTFLQYIHFVSESFLSGWQITKIHINIRTSTELEILTALQQRIFVGFTLVKKIL